jgi:hypothetical protein
MAITTVDQALAGMQQPREFVKNVTGTMVVGRPHSLWYIGGIPPAGATVTNFAIATVSSATPAVFTTSLAHGFVANDRISISGVTMAASSPTCDGPDYTIASAPAVNTFTCTGLNTGWTGTGGVAYSFNRGAGVGTPGLIGITQTAGATPAGGALPFTNPVSGNTYLARFQGMSTVAGTLLLCDRLWENSGISATKTTEQLFTGSVQIPARDQNGTNNGVGVYAGVEVAIATGATNPAITVKYTNSAGTAGRTGTNIVANVASSIMGTFYPISLQAGDLGVQKAESITFASTQTSGTVQVVLYRVLARLELTTANVPNAVDALTSGFPRLYDNTVPFLIFIPSAVTTSNICGHAIWTQG